MSQLSAVRRATSSRSLRRRSDRKRGRCLRPAFWGNERPVTLVWLALRPRRRPARALVRRSDASARRRASTRAPRAAACRSPGRTPATTSCARLQQAWSGNHDALVDAARRYGADGVLIGRARRRRGHLRVEWSFTSAGLPARRRGRSRRGARARGRPLCRVYCLAGCRDSARNTSSPSAASTRSTAMPRPCAAREARAGARRRRGRGDAGRACPSGAMCAAIRSAHQAILRDGRLAAVDAARLIYALSP